MNKMIRNIMMVLLLLVGSTPALYAQYNPTNPPEPEENVYYEVTVSSSHANAAYIYGSGKFTAGTQITVNYSLRNSSYTFSHWTLNGEYYSNNSSFTYTVTAADVEFVAHFSYTPTSPIEPSVKDEYRLFLESDNDAACSFNIASGTLVSFDNYITLTTYVNQGYDFLGWYKNGELINSNTSFNYLMPSQNVTLTAKFKYNPFNPSEPESDGSQENVESQPATGDVNNDNVVDILDIVAVVNYTLGEADENKWKFDINRDGVVDMLDIVKIVNLTLDF